MNQKSLVWIGSIVGSTIGGAIPMLWGDDAFSMSSVFCGAIGAILGIYLAFKLSN